MGKPRLINATDLVKSVLEERDKIRTEVVERYSLGVAVPDRHGQAMRGGIRKALRCIETAPTIDAEAVTRCRDCEYFRITDCGWDKCGFKLYEKRCALSRLEVRSGDYCSKACKRIGR